jgi:hypothetical protein
MSNKKAKKTGKKTTRPQASETQRDQIDTAVLATVAAEMTLANALARGEHAADELKAAETASHQLWVVSELDTSGSYAIEGDLIERMEELRGLAVALAVYTDHESLSAAEATTHLLEKTVNAIAMLAYEALDREHPADALSEIEAAFDELRENLADRITRTRRTAAAKAVDHFAWALVGNGAADPEQARDAIMNTCRIGVVAARFADKGAELQEAVTGHLDHARAQLEARQSDWATPEFRLGGQWKDLIAADREAVEKIAVETIHLTYS